MELRELRVDVSAPPRPRACRPPPQSPPRALRALLATTEAAARRPFDAVLLYLHGFPDLAVHPARVAFASRMPLKLADWWLTARAGGRKKHAAFVTFNFGGTPGSDASGLRFRFKTVSQEVQDAVAVCGFARSQLLRDGGRLHVVGLSTGAIVAALLRAEPGLCDSIAALAGLLDVPRGVPFDFSPRQRAQCDADGYCWKEFYLPDGSSLPESAELSFDGEHRATAEQLAAVKEGEAPSKLFMRLDKQYVDECMDGSLDVHGAVSGELIGSAPLAPLLVVHGSDDLSVPLENGEALFAAAAERKTLLVIPRANHLLTNSKHLKKALQALGAHTDAADA